MGGPTLKSAFVGPEVHNLCKKRSWGRSDSVMDPKSAGAVTQVREHPKDQLGTQSFYVWGLGSSFYVRSLRPLLALWPSPGGANLCNPLGGEASRRWLCIPNLCKGVTKSALRGGGPMGVHCVIMRKKTIGPLRMYPHFG
jgi:hypothetical protein